MHHAVHMIGPSLSVCADTNAPFVALGPMSTTALSMRGPRGINPKGGTLQQLIRENRFKLSENLEMAGVNDLLQ